MNKFLIEDNSDLIINYENLKKYSNEIKIIRNNSLIYEKIINENIRVDCSTYNNGDNIKLYIKKTNSWFYTENLFLNFIHKISLNEDMVLNIIDEFESKIGDYLNGN